MKLPKGYRECTQAERPAFDAANACIVIRVWEEDEVQMPCPSQRWLGDLCEHHQQKFAGAPQGAAAEEDS